MELEIGMMAVDPVRGVGEIVRIEEKTIAGHTAKFHILEVVGTAMLVAIPFGGAELAGIRPVMSKRTAKKVLDELKSDEVAVTASPWNRRLREYTEKLQSGDPLEVAKVFRDLGKLRAEKELSFMERNILEKARDLVVDELAVAKNTSREKILKKVGELLGGPVD